MDGDDATVEATYSPGDWVAVAGSSGWLLVDLPPSSPVVQQCWQLLRQGAAVEPILDALVAGGVGQTASFALLSVAGTRLRLILRGAATARLGDEETPLTAADGTTWVDRWVDDHAPVSLAGTSAQDSGLALPMSGGVTMASTIRLATVAAPAVPVESVMPAAPAVPVEAAATPPLPEAPSYDHLFGDTQRPPTETPAASADPAQTAGWSTLPPPAVPVPSIEPAQLVEPAQPGLIDAVPWGADPAPSAPPAPAAPVVPLGPPAEMTATVDRSTLLAGSPPISGPTVLAALCPAGHLSPAHAARCRVCGADMPPQQPFEAPRPTLGVLRLSTGDVVPLDRGVILGRAPEPPTGNDPDRPNVLRLASPSNDISRAHAEVLLDGWHVLVRDLGSTNGTTITLFGQQPVRLRPGDIHPIEPGTVVSLADEVTFRYEVGP